MQLPFFKNNFHTSHLSLPPSLPPSPLSLSPLLTIIFLPGVELCALVLQPLHAAAQRHCAEVDTVRLVHQVSKEVLGVFGHAAELLYESGESVDHDALQLVLDLGGKRRSTHEYWLDGSLDQRHDSTRSVSPAVSSRHALQHSLQSPPSLALKNYSSTPSRQRMRKCYYVTNFNKWVGLVL